MIFWLRFVEDTLIPGHDFDPRSRQFSEEELRPQPMTKKSRKQYVPDGLKDEKYWARRQKNNVAAKRSRDARRVKENQIAMRANFLENEVVVDFSISFSSSNSLLLRPMR